MADLTHGCWLVTGRLAASSACPEFIRQALAQFPDLHIVNIDSLSYAASPERLATVEKDSRYTFVKGDIAERPDVDRAVAACRNTPVGGCNAIINFAAESHVDRSIFSGVPFVRGNTYGRAGSP